MRFQDLLYKGAHQAPDAVALRWVDRDRKLTYAQAVDEMERVAGALASLGIVRGDRVGVFAHNGMDYVMAMFGAWRLGAIATLVNVQYADELDYYINDATPRVLIYTGDHYATIDRHRPNLPGVEHYVCLDGEQPGALSWPELLDGAPAPPPDATQESDPAHLSYTSGTTGNPKGAVLAHEPTARATHCIAERLQVRSTDVTLGPTALSSSYQLVANLLPGLHLGAAVSIMSRWEPDNAWQVMDELGVTLLAANPPFLRDVLDVSRQKQRPPSGLRVGLSGGGPVPPDLKLAWRDELGVPLVESYGQSELGGFVALGFPEPLDDERALAVGMPLPDKEVRIVDGDDDQLPVGEIGEIVLRGGFMVGYWQRPEQTAETLRGGWLHTGDVGRVDGQGFVYMRGRLKERITVGGQHVYPRDLEEALARHAAVKDAAVIGLPDDSLGQRPKAFVTLRPGESATAEELLSHAGTELSDLPEALTLEIIERMPMTPTGKISKAQLIVQEQAGV